MSQELTVLTYHRVARIEANFMHHQNVVSATPTNFEKQLSYILAKRTLISAQDLLLFIQENRALPKKATLITFDDGYRDNYTEAFPILTKYNARAIFFVTSGYIDQNIRSWSEDLAVMINTASAASFTASGIGLINIASSSKRSIAVNRVNQYIKNNPGIDVQAYLADLMGQLRSVNSNNEERLFMNWKEIQEMHEAGMYIAPHTHMHNDLTKISLERARSDIKLSLDRLTDRVGFRSKIFAYPYGQNIASTPELFSVLEDIGIKLAFTTSFGMNNLTAHTNMLNLKRYNIHHSVTMFKFKLILRDKSALIYHLKQKLTVSSYFKK
jgi:peptidoglycan/xylan/chitin deacetylase (PgdA/CDA1 family)